MTLPPLLTSRLKLGRGTITEYDIIGQTMQLWASSWVRLSAST